MQRAWTGTIVLAALALGLRWLEAAGERASATCRVERAERVFPPAGIAEPTPRIPEDPALAAQSESTRSREPDPDCARRAAELARAHWVEGRVLFPPHTPADDVCFVVADGREFSDGSLHRSRVEPDGHFRVAFSPEAKAGWIDLESRWLFLDVPARWLLAEAAREFTLAPELGGAIAGRLRGPPGALAAVDGEVKLALGPSLRAPLRAGGEFAFEKVPCDRRITLAYRGASWLGHSQPIELAPGETRRVELELVAGVVLGGKVRDQRGRGISGATVLALGSAHTAETRRDGTFRLPALEAGARTLLVSCAGYLPVRRDLGSFAAGQRRLDLAFVLARGATIAGTVFAPDGSPAVAHVRVSSEPGETPGRSWFYTQSASDGTFLLQGLLPGSYRIEAWRVDLRGKIEVRPQTVVAGTRDVALHLGPEDGG